jgi:serine/threonine protein kinase/tetratricopeptide (TPR) repeat protein
MKNSAICAAFSRPAPKIDMNAPRIFESVRIQDDVVACQQCRSTSRVARGLCLNCLLQEGLAPGTETIETLEAVLDEIDVRDADWRLGNYQILEEIGRGGMGVIYRARQRHSRRIVALKRVLSYHADSRETLARFRREAEAAASLDHPNILPIYEVGQSEDGLPFFSMKFAAGGSLLESRVALHNDPRRSVALMAKVARAVQYAHSRGILHRDLKPGNILLDGRGEPLVSDFGLAKWLDTTSDLTRTLTIFGTPGYIAPEQAQGPAKNLTPTADIYSMGAVLFDLFTGRPPFLGEHALAVIRQAAEKPAPKLRSLVPKAGRDLETICAKCLEREPQTRYQSAGDLAVDLERWLEGRPIVARPVSAPLRVWRWSRRNPKLATSVAISLLIAGSAVTRQIQTRHLSATVQRDALAMHSVAVLPFLNLDNPKDEGKFADGIVLSLRKEMSKLGPALVAPFPTSGRNFVSAATIEDLQEASKRCGARSVLSGTIRIIEGKMRVSVRLQNAASGQMLINRIIQADGPDGGGSSFAHSIAAEIYSTLDLNDLSSVEISKRDPAFENRAARDLILAGRELESHRTTLDFDRAIECFRNAFRAEPLSALARADFVMAVMSRIHMGPSNEALFEQAEEEASKAIKLNPQLGEAHRAMASVSLQKNDLSAAVEEVLRAIELSGPEERPALFMGMLARGMGQPGKALSWYEIAKRWEKRPANNEFIVGDCLVDLQEDERAQTVYTRVSELHPELPEGWIGMCRLHMLHQDYSAARAIYATNRDRYKDFAFTDQIGAQVEFFARNFTGARKLYEELVRRDPDGGGDFYGRVTFQSALGHLLLLTGDRRQGQALLGQCLTREQEALKKAPRDAGALYRLAAIEASLERTNSSLDHLGAAAESGWIDCRSLALDPRFDGLRKEARYHKIFETMATRVASSRGQKSAQQ